jgi:tRNA(Ile)-lysidine synthase
MTRPDASPEVLDAVQAGGLLAGTEQVVVLLSGGRDSVCLLDVAVTLCGAHRLRVLHVNYGLRPGADGDDQHCRQLCERLGLTLTVTRATRPYEHPGNLQAWARDVRYAEATRIALAHDALVATGHTASDLLETVLYRLASSPGRRALLGMPAREGRLVRPLLAVTREQTTAHCLARGLDWREDPSNETTEYARGRVRHGVLPALRTVHPAAESNVLRTAALLRDEASVLDEVVSTALAGRDRIALSHLAELPPALARLIVVRLAEDAGGGPLPASAGRLQELLALAAGGGSAALDLGAGVRAIVEYGVLRMTAEPEEPAPEAVTLAVPGHVRFGAWEVASELEAEGGAVVAPAGSERLDAGVLGERVVVRAWRAGDRMTPLGLRGTKTLADLFTERRLPRAARGTIPVLEAAGRIAWVPGIAIDDRFRVTDDTRSAARLSARRVDPAPPSPAVAPLDSGAR